jgi:hypothetical protein
MRDELSRLIAEASVLAGGKHPCAVLGHKWVSTGGANCGCRDGCCSVPVHQCDSCGDYDYGDNDEADEMREACEFRVSQNSTDPHTTFRD